MKKSFNTLFILLILYIHSISVFSQESKEEYKVLNSVILYKITNGVKHFYIDCDKAITFFDLDLFLQETTLVNIPKNVLSEIVSRSKNDTKNKAWDCNLIRNLNLNEDLLLRKNCLKNKEIKKLLKTKSRYNILSIHRPIFDKEINHCVVDLTIMTNEGAFNASSFVLKKVYGKWIILEEFNFSMS